MKIFKLVLVEVILLALAVIITPILITSAAVSIESGVLIPTIALIMVEVIALISVIMFPILTLKK